MRRFAVWISCLAISMVPTAAHANGVSTHAHISDLAVRELPPGELRDLLSDPEVLQALHSGSVFPDSGYAADHPYGEIAHWEPFTNAYLEWIATEHPPPFTELEDRQRVAFLLGAMSHGMADQVFDSLFMHKIEQNDGMLGDFDRRSEMWLVVEHDPGIAPLTVVLPSTELPSILLASSGESSSPEDFERGMGLIRTAIALIPRLAPAEYEDAWYALPWGATHYYSGLSPDGYLPGSGEGGSIPHIGYVVARYWEVVWERLHHTDSIDRSFVASWPEEGAVNVEVTAGRAESRAMLVFGHAIDGDSFPGSFHVRPAAGGDDVAAHARFQWSNIANAVLVIWDEDLSYDTEYLVELDTDLRMMDGRNLPAPVSVSFHTRCAPDALDDCPPLPEAWVAPSMPPARDAGMRDGGVRLDAPGDAGVEPADSGCACRAGDQAPLSSAYVSLFVLALCWRGLRVRDSIAPCPIERRPRHRARTPT